jgi:hypothetical protein
MFNIGIVIYFEIQNVIKTHISLKYDSQVDISTISWFIKSME